MKKRCLSLALALCLVLSLMAIPAAAEEPLDIFPLGTTMTKLGDTYQIRFVVPADISGMKYSSSDKNVATVDSNGLVTAVGYGHTSIGCSKDGEYSSCDIVVAFTPDTNKIILSAQSIKIDVGENFFMDVAASIPNESILFWMRSDNPAVATSNTVTSKLITVTGVAPGTATLYVRLGTTYVTCPITVGHFIPKSVTLDVTEKEIPAGERFQLVSTIGPATAEGVVTYSSSKPAVATVDANGLVKAIKAGSTTITAKVKGRDVETTCKVVVTPGKVLDTVITPPTKRVYRKGESLNLEGGKVTLKNSDGTSKTLPLNDNMVSGYDKYTLGEQELTITYGKTTANYTITLNDKVVKSTDILVPYKTSYNYGQELVVSDGRIKIVYEGYTKDEIVITADMVTGYNPYQAGKQTLTITYGDVTKQYMVIVKPKVEDKPAEKPANLPTTKPVEQKPATPQISGTVAVPSSTKLVVNGKSVAVDSYMIEENNYIKLRDLATMITGTPKNFNVGWDGAQNAISLTPYTPYTAVGGEMASGDRQAKAATISTSAVMMRDSELDVSAYLIGQNNYFKLRDIMEIFNVYVGWDQASGTATLDTTKNYE